MIAKDILRIALFLLVAIFALRSGYRFRFRGSVRVNNTTETEDTETHQLLQRLQGDNINQEQKLYENKSVGEGN
jgi:hypothetical protein